ncbi:hypothetical protein HKD37_07G018603 [Glycine soja]
MENKIPNTSSMVSNGRRFLLGISMTARIKGWYMNLVSAFNIKMARTTLSSIFVPFLILLVIAITFFAELTPVSADLKMRKLGSHPSPPPPLRAPPRHTRPPPPAIS